MLCEDKVLRLIDIFIVCDDFCNALTAWQRQQGTLPTTRASQLTDSEMLAITIFYHYSGAKCFQYYYQNCVEPLMETYFPKLISYERFVARMPRLLPGLFILLKWLCAQSQRTGFYIIDSKALAVCDNHRITTNRVFANVAARGKSSMAVHRCGVVLRFKGTSGHQSIRPVSQLCAHGGQRG